MQIRARFAPALLALMAAVGGFMAMARPAPTPVATVVPVVVSAAAPALPVVPAAVPVTRVEVIPEAAAPRPMAAPPATAAERLIGRARVKDGDTIEIDGVAIRLEGIDAPERSQRCTNAEDKPTACGETARFALMRLTRDRVLTCTGSALDRYGRRLMRCATPETGDLGRALVRAGHALAFRRYSDDYIGDEAVAQAARTGLWAGRFTPPWDERRAPGLPPASPPAAAPLPLAAVPAPPQLASSRAVAEPAGACLIKGNHSRSGERIYHRPGQRHYDRTVIDHRAGERWFCTPAEAEAAGYRAAMR